MHKGFLKTAAIFGFLSVGLGAFGAHALKEIISRDALVTFETGVRYQFYHALALLCTGMLFKEFRMHSMEWAGRMFIAGILLFSFSLYILALLQTDLHPQYKWIGMITPFGGLAFLAGWGLLFYSFIKSQKTL